MRRIGGSIRAARSGVIASALTAVVLAVICVVGAPAFGAMRSSGLLGSPLVVPSAESFLGGQQQAAEAARRANPEAVAARARSRTTFARLSSVAVARLLSQAFPDVIDHPAGGTPPLPAGAHVVGYPGTNAIQLSLPGHRIGIVESTSPLAKRASHGHFAPINLALRATGDGFAPANSNVAVAIPRVLSAGISTPQNGVSLTPVDSGGHRFAGARGGVVGSSVVYPNTQPTTDTLVKPTPTGFQLDAVLRSVESPEQLFFKVDAPSGSILTQDPDSGIVRVILNGAKLATILPPGAVDAAGTIVPASMSVAGHMLTITVLHRAGSYLYPIDVDPEINDSQLAEVTGGKRANWEFKSSNEARFGHKAVYEGPGKEHLETTGTAEYVATEFAYWAYETKGNSKIYELKTKTSAKNKLAWIESFLEFQYSGGKESKQLLSTEGSEPEYSEKVSTICAWNASKIEECLPASGKEKNAIRFQQSATKSPGANFKFSDTMSEGIVSISEPAGQHSTTSYNTTSPEVEGEVEGKMQKRVNALYGAGIWLTKFKGALQFISKDPGIGVAATRLEYEKSAGSWETLSSHNYLENEKACKGVQCYSEHAEYWTVDPKLPDGEDKIRYRAEEAIAGTVSPEGEAESTKTVKVDTAAPHGTFLAGLPYGNELSEKPYKLIAVTFDGTGSTIPSSGVKKLALFVAGHEITELGTQTGCSVAKGECLAKAEWSLNGAELGAGHHAIVIVATDNAGNESRLEETISIRHSTPVPMGPGSVDLQSGDFALSSTDASFGSGLTVARNYSSRDLTSGNTGPLGPEWNIGLGSTESLVEIVDGGVLMTAGNGSQTIFAPLGGGKFESPQGDSNLELSLEENAEKVKLAYYLKDSAKKTSVKFTQTSAGTPWVPTKQEGTVATDTVTYKYQAAEQYSEYSVTGESRPKSLIVGPDGYVWFVEPESAKIGKISPTGAVTEYESVYTKPEDIALGSDGNLWIDYHLSNRVVKMSPGGHKLAEYFVSTSEHVVRGITPGPDGNLWFIDPPRVGKITTAGSYTEYTVTSGWPNDITTGPDGNLWFSEFERSVVGKVTTSGTITTYALSAGRKAYKIVSGPDGKLWLSMTANKVGKITTTGTVTEYALPTGAEAGEMVVGPDGNLWSPLWYSGSILKMGKITTSGTVTQYSLPTKELKSLVVGSEGNIWFGNDYPSSTIGVMPTSGVIVEPTEELAPKPAGVSCEPELKAGCRALKFSYSSETTATGENSSQWGQFRSRLSKVMFVAYNTTSKVMQETAVAEYSYDKLGRLRAEWDPRISPALKTTYGYDLEGHVTAADPPGQEPWTFGYGTIAGDTGTGRLLKVTRAPASAALWNGEAITNTEKPGLSPKIGGIIEEGQRLTVSNGKWTGSPIAYTYQWEDCSSEGGFVEHCKPILGATNPNYTLQASDIGYLIKAKVTATNGGGSLTVESGSTIEYVRAMAESFYEATLPAGSLPFGISGGPDGNVWFTDTGTGKVGKITPNRTVTEYTSNPNEPEGITTGSDGNLWFVDHSIRHVNHMTTSGTLTTFTLTRTNTYNVGIAAGPDNNLWFTESNTNYIGKITTGNVVAGEYALPAGSKPYGITNGPDGNLWFTDFGTSKIGKITTSGTITEYALPAGSEPYSITTGPDGNLWFTDSGTSKIGKITTSGTITEYALPAGSGPRGITAGPDGAVWFTDYTTSKIGKITTSGTISEHALPAGSQPLAIVTGPDGSMWFTDYGTNKIGKIEYAQGEYVAPQPGFSLNYDVPMEGATAPEQMGTNPATGKPEPEAWGQKDDPVEATAIVPPDSPQGWPASSYTRATVYYLDSRGRTVNIAKPSEATYGSVTTTEYNELNDVVRTLSADNRVAALEAGSKSVEVSKLLDTIDTYNGEGAHESEVEEPGTQLIDVLGPQHKVKYMVGKEQKESLARNHVKYFFNEGAPGGEKYDLVTKTTDLAQLANEEEVEVRKTTTSYSGQSNLGWKLRAPTSVTTDPEGAKITKTTLYNSTTGQISETRDPAGSGGSSAHDVKYIYYSAEANTEGYTTCGSHPEWAGLLCETLPAKQPEAGAKLPVSVITYNIFNEPLVTTETFGSTVRTKTNTYDGAGRLTGSETTSTVNAALPKITNEYSSTLGSLEKQSTTVEGKTKTVTSKFDKLGELTEYVDADGNTAKYVYGTPENGGLLQEVTDGSNEGTGKQVYTYNATTKLMEKLVDSAAGTFTATYDVEGNLASEVYPNAMCANYTRDAVGTTTQVQYIKTSNCKEASPTVWYTETRMLSVRGETFTRSSTLSNETYAYDTLGRLTETQETPAGKGCNVRLYGYDEESNRTSQTTRVPGGGGACATEGGTVQNHTYDEANRLTDSGIEYDTFGNVTKLPGVDAEGHELSSTFYVDNAVATQSQNGVSSNYYLDPTGRVRETVSGGNTVVSHYDGSGETVVWTSETGGKSTRNIPGIDGDLAATQTNGGTPVLQLRDLEGNIAATAALSTEAGSLLSTYDSTEFGVPNAEKAPPKFGWLGAGAVASTLSSGVITYGATSYVPQTGRALQSEAVQPPGAPGGTGAGSVYNSQQELWVFQGAAAEATEAPGLEAARELAAFEAALAASQDVDPIKEWNLKNARSKAEELSLVLGIAEVLDFLDVPKSVGDLAEAALSKVGLDVIFKWFKTSAAKLMKCADNHRDLHICRYHYEKREFNVGPVHLEWPDFWYEPQVYECEKYGPSPSRPGPIVFCFYEVYIYPWEG